MKKVLSITLVLVLCSLIFCGCGAKEGSEPGTAIIDGCNIEIKSLSVGVWDNISDIVLLKVKFENNSNKAHSLTDVCHIDVYRDGEEVEMESNSDCWKEILPGNSLDIVTKSRISEDHGRYTVIISTNLGKKVTEKEFVIS